MSASHRPPPSGARKDSVRSKALLVALIAVTLWVGLGALSLEAPANVLVALYSVVVTVGAVGAWRCRRWSKWTLTAALVPMSVGSVALAATGAVALYTAFAVDAGMELGMGVLLGFGALAVCSGGSVGLLSIAVLYSIHRGSIHRWLQTASQ